MARRTKDKFASLVHDIGEDISKKIFLKLPFSPTQLNLMNFFCLIIASLIFALGQWKYNLIAFVFILLSTQFDFADGVVARERKLVNRFGGWFDPFLDLVGQHIIFIGASLGVMRNYNYSPLVVLICVLGLWSIALNNTIGLTFNGTFGFDSYIGSQDFSSKYQSLKKVTSLEKFLFNTVSPHSFSYFVIYTLRYFLLVGIFFNLMLPAIVLITFFGFLRAILMIGIYVLYLQERKENRVVRILSEIEKI